MRDNQLEPTLDRLRKLFQKQYEQGSKDALIRIFDTIKGGQNEASSKARKRGQKQRAARGSARAFIERVLNEKKTASVPTIMAAARSPAERRVSVAAVRFELWRGKKDRKYRNSKGQWSLAAAERAG